MRNLRLSLRNRRDGRQGGQECLSRKMRLGIGTPAAPVEVGVAEKLGFFY